MADNSKLSVEQALQRLRGTEPRRTKVTQLDDKIDALDRDIREMKAQNRRLARDQKAGPADRKD